MNTTTPTSDETTTLEADDKKKTSVEFDADVYALIIESAKRNRRTFGGEVRYLIDIALKQTA